MSYDFCRCDTEYTHPVGADSIRPPADGIERLNEWRYFPTRTVGADSIRPNVTGMSCPMNGAMLDAVPFNRVLAKIQGCGRMLSAPTIHSSNPSVRDVVEASPRGLPSMRLANCWPVMDSLASR